MSAYPLPQQTQSSSPLSPNPRHPLTRPLSPDLPSRDALYLFANFSSYMRSPGEGAQGIVNSKDFFDTVRLLDHARALAAAPAANVHVLHLKYRFQSAVEQTRSPYASGDFRQPINYQDTLGRLRNPVPQPFSVLHDPVIKIDLKENGVFEPLPAEAIFMHIAKACQPPPRIIVISYVGSKVTCNHLASLSKWALASSPPIYIFSPLETRLRERQALRDALAYAVPISMYAWPPADNDEHSPFAPPSVASGPVATLSVQGSASHTSRARLGAAVGEPERIPLWMLAPGIGALQGSTAASVGIRLDDFFAVNMTDEQLLGQTPAGKGPAPTETNSTAAARGPSISEGKPLGLPILDAVADPLVRPSSTAPPAVKVPEVAQHSAAALVQPFLTDKPSSPRSQSWPAPINLVNGWKQGRSEEMDDTIDDLLAAAAERGEPIVRQQVAREPPPEQRIVRELLGLCE